MPTDQYGIYDSETPYAAHYQRLLREEVCSRGMGARKDVLGAHLEKGAVHQGARLLQSI